MENYIVLEHIGEGSFGKVYKARRKNTGFTVAMKFITKHGKSDKDIRTLRQEIGILRKLNHENIILMFDAFETEREFCVVTEYAQGELFDILQVSYFLLAVVSYRVVEYSYHAIIERTLISYIDISSFHFHLSDRMINDYRKAQYSKLPNSW